MFNEKETQEILKMKEKIYNYFTYDEGKLFHDILKVNKVPTECAFLSGGCFASLLSNELVNDIDIFFTHSAYAQKVYDYVIREMEDQVADNSKYYGNSKSITSNQVKMKNRLSFITFMSGTPEEIIKTFDFVHCTPRYDIANNKLYITRDAYDCIKNKKMKLQNQSVVPKPYRVEKLKKRGWV